MNCYYCGWRNGHHDPNCPNVAKDPLHIWEEGYADGRIGTEPTNTGKVYRLGYGRGIVALESYENGYDPRFD